MFLVYWWPMELETKRLILRKPKKGDWKDLVEGVAEFDVAKMTKAIPHPYHEEDAKSFIKILIKRWLSGKDYTFLLELKSEKKVIGAMAISNINQLNGTASTGSWINKKYWKKGYITEAKIAVNDFAFSQLGLRRLDSTVFTDNKASNATQQKIGYKFEGMKRKATKSKSTGKIHDVNVYGLLKSDWKKARGGLIREAKKFL